jgi:hypothetical protein
MLLDLLQIVLLVVVIAGDAASALAGLTFDPEQQVESIPPVEPPGIALAPISWASRLTSSGSSPRGSRSSRNSRASLTLASASPSPSGRRALRGRWKGWAIAMPWITVASAEATRSSPKAEGAYSATSHQKAAPSGASARRRRRAARLPVG